MISTAQEYVQQRHYNIRRALPLYFLLHNLTSLLEPDLAECSTARPATRSEWQGALPSSEMYGSAMTLCTDSPVRGSQGPAKEIAELKGKKGGRKGEKGGRETMEKAARVRVCVITTPPFPLPLRHPRAIPSVAPQPPDAQLVSRALVDCPRLESNDMRVYSSS